MKFKTKTREASIEKKVVQIAHSFGWKVYKFVSPNNRGVPDRLAIKDGKTIYFEMKRPSEKLRPLQVEVHKEFLEYGVAIAVFDNTDDAREFFRNA